MENVAKEVNAVGGCGGYPSNWKFSFSATVAIRRRVCPHAELISFHST